MTRVLLIFKAAVNFSLLLSTLQLCTEPATEVYTETSQHQREYTLYEYPYSSALRLDGAIREFPGDVVEG